jgi:pimeloyl-ACP methyl ester carboxylesterase
MTRKSRPQPPPPAEAPPPTEPPETTTDLVVRDVAYSSADGLSLFARDYGDRLSPWMPVVCLAGLTRNSRDFHDLAAHLSTHRHRPRRVVTFDYRGRGRSDRAKSSHSYNPLAEMNDVFDGMAALGIPRAVVVGTSRGGIIGMLMALARPASVTALVLNDVGPKIEALGLARIKAAVGGTPLPVDWPDAVRLLRRLHGASFTNWTDQEWDEFARRTFRDENGLPARDYDPALAETFEGVEFDEPVPHLWDEFRSLKALPMLVIRGENSDLLSAGTVATMTTLHPQVESVTVANEGHPPALRPGQLLTRISAFITAAVGNAPPADAILPQEVSRYDLDAGPATTEQS